MMARHRSALDLAAWDTIINACLADQEQQPADISWD